MAPADRQPAGRGRWALKTVLLVGIALNAVLLVYGLAAYPGSRGGTSQDLLPEALLIVLLFLYLYAALYGARAYGPLGRWIHRQGIVFGLAAGVLWAGEVLFGSLGDTPLLGSLRTVHPALYRAIGLALLAAAPALVLLAAGRAGFKTGQAASGVQVGLWGGLISALAAAGGLLLMTYAAMGALALSPANVSDFTASGDASLPAFLVKNARLAATAYLALGLVSGPAVGGLGGLVGRLTGQAKRFVER